MENNIKVEITKHQRTLEREKPFVLIGNEIDGRLFCPHIYDFKNFSDLKKRLSDILKSIRGEGEWAFDLYQVEADYKIWHRYGYYKYPHRRKFIFKYDYCHKPIKKVIIGTNKIEMIGIYVFNQYKDDREFWFEFRRFHLDWE